MRASGSSRSIPPALRGLTRLLDDAVRIPGTRVRVGLDALLGLVPGVGDLVGGALSGAVLVAGARLGAPPAVLARMLLNVAVDVLLGSVPMLGDLFDVGWKANRRNLGLLEAHLSSPEATAAGSRRVLAGAAVAVTATLALLAAGAGWIVVRLCVSLL